MRISVIDSHTGGEPTRVVVAGGPELGDGSMAERLARFRGEFDHLRSAVVNEPRGSEVLVGALLVTPVEPANAAGVIFFNNVGYLGMCGHGAIGVVATLQHLGRLAPGAHRLETPVGTVSARLHESGAVSVENVASYREQADVSVEVEGLGTVRGDVAWGGNWFFLAETREELALANVERLTDAAWRIRRALAEQGITGSSGAEIDHIELCGPSPTVGVSSRNFVLCPGKAYDRSPCGTGTSAKLAALFAEGRLAEGEIWRQESIAGSVFEGTVRVVDGAIIPTITGRAFITTESTLVLDPADPLRWGVR